MIQCPTLSINSFFTISDIRLFLFLPALAVEVGKEDEEEKSIIPVQKEKLNEN
jgi:hypothetical protein